MRWLTGEAKKLECFRTDVPYGKSRTAKESYVANLRQAVDHLFDRPDLIASFMNYWPVPPRRAFNLPFSAQDDLVSSPRDVLLELTSTKGLVYRWTEDRLITLATPIGDASLCVDGAAEPLIGYLNGNAPVRLSKFVEDFQDTFDDVPFASSFSIWRITNCYLCCRIQQS